MSASISVVSLTLAHATQKRVAQTAAHNKSRICAVCLMRVMTLTQRGLLAIWTLAMAILCCKTRRRVARLPTRSTQCLQSTLEVRYQIEPFMNLKKTGEENCRTGLNALKITATVQQAVQRAALPGFLDANRSVLATAHSAGLSQLLGISRSVIQPKSGCTSVAPYASDVQ